MSSFAKFHAKKVEELEARSATFEQLRMFGTHPYSTRQPAAFFYYLTLLERFTPEVSKSEVIFEAVQAAFRDVIQPQIDEMPESRREFCQDVYSMMLQAYCIKCAKSQSELDEKGGFAASDESKALADEFLAHFESGDLDYGQLLEKYKNTPLDTVNYDGE